MTPEEKKKLMAFAQKIAEEVEEKNSQISSLLKINEWNKKNGLTHYSIEEYCNMYLIHLAYIDCIQDMKKILNNKFFKK